MKCDVCSFYASVVAIDSICEGIVWSWFIRKCDWIRISREIL